MDSEKEYDPSLEFDAFTAGVEDGGIRSSSTIAIIVCYIVCNIEENITAKNIVDALVEGKLANYFEVTNAISKMIKKGNITEDENGCLGATPKCRFSVEIVENDLPLSVREKSVELVRKLAALEVNKKENKVSIEPYGDKYKITLHVSDVDSDFMTLSLYVPTQAQAEVIKNKFVLNPAAVYEGLINSIFDNEE